MSLSDALDKGVVTRSQSRRNTESSREETFRNTMMNASSSEAAVCGAEIHKPYDKESNPDDQASEARSVLSHKSRSSTTSSLILKQKAKTEAAKVRLKYIEKEAQIEKERASLEAELKVLNAQRSLEETEASLHIMETLEEVNSQDGSEIDIQDTQERTAEFIQNIPPKLAKDLSVASEIEFTPPVIMPLSQSAKPRNLNPNAECFTPNVNQNNMCAEITKFIMKKDLSLSRLAKFDDSPEFFCAWKTSFRSITKDLDLTALEEMDLLINWLGPESVKQAKRIRAANASNPSLGVQRIWERLEDRFASPEMIETSIKRKLSSFPKLSSRDHDRLFELSDIVSEIEAIKEDSKYTSLFSYYDASSGVNPIVAKLPVGIQEKWATQVTNFKKRTGKAYPSFTIFSSFLRDMAKMKNDPSLDFESHVQISESDHYGKATHKKERPIVSVRKTDSALSPVRCPLHKTEHTLNKCRAFRAKPIEERRDFIRKQGLCFKCCGQNKHKARDCRRHVSCELCGKRHPTALHIEFPVSQPMTYYEGEKEVVETPVKANCTQVCGQTGTSKSCAKTVLVNVYPQGKPHLSLRLYAMMDDQSNRSLASPSFFDHFKENGPHLEYALSTCSGSQILYGRRTSGYVVESIYTAERLILPTLIECDNIPNSRDEIPFPDVVEHFPHLRELRDSIPPIDDNAEISLLIGRDLVEAHHVLDQRIGPYDTPFAQKLPLGWVVIGNVCLGKVHQQNVVNVNKTHIMGDGRPTLLTPCENNIHLKVPADPIFQRTKYDEKPALSIEDQEFLSIMNQNFRKDENDQWMAPLPFRSDRVKLPNNRPHAMQRAMSLNASLKKNAVKRDHMITFMKRVIDNGHAEVAPPLPLGAESWYLPLFGVYHHKKPNEIRCVFDSSSKYQGVSLNDVLLTGPDLINSLLGILLRFRKDRVAMTADIQQMFYCFSVEPKHRDFLRFLWYRDNNPDLELIEYRMTVHVFGNRPSPAIATYGLRKTVQDAAPDVKDFVERNFYVDDGLVSCSNDQLAVSLMKRSQQTLLESGKLRLHKVASNSQVVLENIETDDLAKGLKDLDLGTDPFPLQRSLGLIWNIENDTFTYDVSTEKKPYTKRGVLSTVHSLYDPIGFMAPVTIQGKFFLRDLMAVQRDWDDPLPEEVHSKWNAWCDSLKILETVCIPRMYSDIMCSEANSAELHIFSDASKEGIGAVCYLKLFDINKSSQVSFVLGKAKVAPRHGHTIPRLELCAAVLAIELSETVQDQLDLNFDTVTYYTDSKVVLGYINNTKRRFHVYVANRVDRIRSSSKPRQWKYIPSEFNPADQASRGISASDIKSSMWFHGPSFLHNDEELPESTFALVDADEDREIRSCVISSKTSACVSNLDSKRFKKFSTWKSLTRGLSVLIRLAQKHSKRVDAMGKSADISITSRSNAEKLVLKAFQSGDNYVRTVQIKMIRDGTPVFYTRPVKDLVLLMST